jgi:pyridoxal phosphate phosphatase PHOSPHO2
MVHAAPHAVSAILSDANTLYIDAVLRKANLADAFEAGIVTNPARILPQMDDVASRVTVSPFRAASGRAPHQCRACPVNMCKGDLVEGLFARYPDARFVYVGDGTNDLCPSRRLASDGTVLPRVGFALSEALLRTTIEAQVLPWESPVQLRLAIDKLVSP